MTAGRVEALINVPSSVTVSATNSGGGATSVGLTAGSYFWSDARTVTSLADHIASQLNATRPCAASVEGWTVALDVTTGLITIDCTSGDRLVENSGAGWDSGATSTTTLAGDGYVQFTAMETGKYRALGLSASGTASVNFNTIAHGINLKGGSTPTEFSIVETGTERTTGTYASGDIFKVVRIGTAITYYQNGTLIWTSAVAASGNQVVDSAFFDSACTLDGVRFFDNGTRTALTWSTTGVTASSSTFSLAWTSTKLRDLLGFTADISSVSAPQTGTKQCRGLWLPDCVLNFSESYAKAAPTKSDMRSSQSPDGTLLSLVGNTWLEHASAKWGFVPKDRVWEAEVSTANASWEFFFRGTQLGLDSTGWFDPSSPILIVDHSGNVVGINANSGTGTDGWQIRGLSDIAPKVSPEFAGTDLRWVIELPALVSSG